MNAGAVAVRVVLGLAVPPLSLGGAGVVLVGVVVVVVVAGCVVVVLVLVLCTGGALATETVFVPPPHRPAAPRAPLRGAARELWKACLIASMIFAARWLSLLGPAGPLTFLLVAANLRGTR